MWFKSKDLRFSFAWLPGLFCSLKGLELSDIVEDVQRRIPAFLGDHLCMHLVATDSFWLVVGTVEFLHEPKLLN